MQTDNADTTQQELLNRLRQERLISAYLSQILTRKAYDRMSNVKFAKRELYLRVAKYLIQLKQQNRIDQLIDDETLKQLLLRFSESSSGDITIRRK